MKIPLNLVKAAAAVLLVACLSCSGSSLTNITGTITVDGAPVEAGTISIRPVDQEAGGNAGGKIEDGRFHAVAREPLSPGKYTVLVQASKKTGRTINDPQRGSVDEISSITLADSPKEIELTAENAENLELAFTKGAQ